MIVTVYIVLNLVGSVVLELFMRSGGYINWFSVLGEIFTYFTTHLWLVFFFILHILIMRTVKSSGDRLNLFWGFKVATTRKL